MSESRRDQIPFVYMLSQNNSGSTLLTFLLNRHEDIVSLGEAQRLSSYLRRRWSPHPEVESMCSSGEPYYDSAFWNKLIANLTMKGVPMSVTPEYLRQIIFPYSLRLNYLATRYPWIHRLYQVAKPLYATRQHEAHRRTKILAETVMEMLGAKIYLDSTKNTNYAYNLMQNPYFDFKIINLVRDGRGVLGSQYRKRKDKGRKTFEALLEQWMRLENSRYGILQLLGDERYITTKYEDIATRPLDELHRIADFLGVDGDKMRLDFYNTEHYIIGNPMRLRDDDEIKLRVTWQQDLSPEFIEIFHERALHHNQRNGYAPDYVTPAGYEHLAQPISDQDMTTTG